MKQNIDIATILESLGYLIPSCPESVIEFEKNFQKEIKQAKPKHWNNPLEILNTKEQRIFSFNIDHLSTTSIGMAQAAREGTKIPDSIKKKMLEDRKNAKNGR